MNSFGSEAPKVLFAGPTYAALKDKEAALGSGFEVRPPARRGDVSTLLETGPGIVVLVDGLFHQALAVGHAELREAIRMGWSVWGLSSMGAIRAYEMREVGMSGFGMVYGHFLADQDFQDDEVAQLHTPAPDYIATTEPMVHLRYFLRELETSGVVSCLEAQQVVDELKAVWYGHRSLDLFASLVDRYSGPAAARVARSWMSDIDRFQVKTRDLEQFLQSSIWRRDGYQAIPKTAPYSRTPL